MFCRLETDFVYVKKRPGDETELQTMCLTTSKCEACEHPTACAAALFSFAARNLPSKTAENVNAFNFQPHEDIGINYAYC